MPTKLKSRPRTTPSSPTPESAPTFPDDVPTLQDQLRLARAQNAYLHRALANALKQAPMAPPDGTSEEQLTLTILHLRESIATLTLHYEQAQQDIAHLKSSLVFAHKVLGWRHELPQDWMLGGEEAQMLDHVLRQLLTLAHPDRWSNGQLAVDLAHELAVMINAQRERLGAQ